MFSSCGAEPIPDRVTYFGVKTQVAALLAAACILEAIGVHRSRSCAANVPGHGTALYWLIAAGVGLAVASAVTIGLRRWSGWPRMGAAACLALLAGGAAYIFEGLSWVGACG